MIAWLARRIWVQVSRMALISDSSGARGDLRSGGRRRAFGCRRLG